jgi:dCMP deaminase
VRDKIADDIVFMNVAKQLAVMSKCVSMQVCCIGVSNGRIKTTGINGTAPGHPNCCDVHSHRGPDHSAWSEKYEIHAEMNAIMDMVRSKVDTEDLTLYITHNPCWNCLKHIVSLNAAGTTKVKRIVYNEQYYRTSDEEIIEAINYCNKSGISLEQI